MQKNRPCRLPVHKKEPDGRTTRARKFFFLLALFSVMSVAAHDNGMSQTVSLDFRNAELRTVLTSLREQTGYVVMYNHDELRTASTTVSVNVRDVSLNRALDEILKGLPFTYVIEDRSILIVPAPEKVRQDNPAREIRGRVTDTDNLPLAGVNVVIKGTQTGTTTDRAGAFAITVSPGQTIEFSFVGMVSRSVVYGGQPFIAIELEENAAAIKDIIITGYQNIDRKKSTSSTSSMSMDDLMRTGATSIDQMLEGRIPDLVFMNNSGEVGVVPKIRIRGTSTLIGNREPLWVIDGIVVSDPVNLSSDVLNDPDYINRIGNAIAGINPQDIERIDVLKDAAATTLYGSRAANGVIVVTTKRGRIGDPVVTYNMNTTLKLRPRYSDRSINLMSAAERLQLSRELAATNYIFPTHMNVVAYEYLLQELYAGRMSNQEFAAQVEKLENTNTDWFDILTEDSWSHEHSVSVSGGGEKARYYASLGYTKSNDVVKNQHLDRYTSTVNLDTNVFSWMDASFSLKGSVSKREYQADGINSIDYAYNTTRLIPAYDDNGEYHYYPKNGRQSNSYGYNILNEIENSSDTQNTNSLAMTTKFDFKVNDWIRPHIQFSYQTQDTRQQTWKGEKSYYAADLRRSEYGEEPESGSKMPFGGELRYRNTANNTYTLRAQVDINKYLGPDSKHNIFASAGYEMSSSRYESYSDVNRGYYKDRGRKFAVVDDSYSEYNAWLSSNLPTIEDHIENLIGAYASATYSYGNLFSVNANARYDGSNQFGSRSNEKLLPVWSVSGMVNIAEIGRVRDIPWLDELRIKTSYGYQGNMLNGQTPRLIITNGPFDTYYNTYTSSVSSFPNPDLKWEKTGTFNVGTEIFLFGSRVQISGEYYRKRTKDAYMDQAISTVNGRDNYTVNGGIVKNNGYNIELTLIPISTANTRWVVATAFSKVTNKVDAASALDTHELSDFLNGTALVKGKPIGTFYSYRFIGLSPVDGGPLFDDWSDYIDRLVGMSKYDTYTSVLRATGKREPSISGNINSTVSYKNYRLSFVLAYSVGAKVRRMRVQDRSYTVTGERLVYPEFNASRELLDRWKLPGDENTTNIPALISSAVDAYHSYNNHWSSHVNYTTTGGNVIAETAWDMYDYADIRVVKADYLKLSNLSFTYSLPQKLLDKLVFSTLEATVSTSNLFTITHKALKGQTPTQGNFQTVQLNERPTFSFGLRVSF